MSHQDVDHFYYENGRLVCDRCKAFEAVELPMPCTEFLSRMHAFESAHADCQVAGKDAVLDAIGEVREELAATGQTIDAAAWLAELNGDACTVPSKEEK